MPLPISFPDPIEGHSYNRAVLRWLDQIGLRHLLDCQRHGAPLPDADELTQFLVAACNREINHPDRILVLLPRELTSSYDEPTDEWLARTAPQAASWVLEKFRPNFLKSASKGGRSHRPRQPKVYPFMVRELGGIPAKEAAAELGCSLATVYRLRKESVAFDLANPPVALMDFNYLLTEFDDVQDSAAAIS